MKVLLDSCVWSGAKVALTQAGHEVEWCGDWRSDPGDEEILKRASNDGKVVVTLDKDFGELTVLRGMRHAGIVRLVGIRANDQGTAAATALQKYAADLGSGAIVTVEASRVRIRPAE